MKNQAIFEDRKDLHSSGIRNEFPETSHILQQLGRRIGRFRVSALKISFRNQQSR